MHHPVTPKREKPSLDGPRQSEVTNSDETKAVTCEVPQEQSSPKTQDTYETRVNQASRANSSLPGPFTPIPKPPQGSSFHTLVPGVQPSKETINRTDIIESGIKKPVFSPCTAQPVSRTPEDLLRTIQPVLEQYIKYYNYDRICYLADLYEHIGGTEKIKEISRHGGDILESFFPQSAVKVPFFKGGHCAALAQYFKEHLPQELKDKGFLTAGEIKLSLSVPSGPKYNHGALLIPYVNPKNKKEKGFILIDPSFDFPCPIAVSNTRHHDITYSMTRKNEIWRFSLSADRNSIICQPRPESADNQWIPQEKDLNKRTIYRTDCLENPDSSITNTVISRDTRPVMLARKPGHQPVGMIAINIRRGCVEARVMARTYQIIFEDIIANDANKYVWPEDSSDLVETAFNLQKEVISQRVAKAVHVCYYLRNRLAELEMPTGQDTRS